VPGKVYLGWEPKVQGISESCEGCNKASDVSTGKLIAMRLRWRGVYEALITR